MGGAGWSCLGRWCGIASVSGTLRNGTLSFVLTKIEATLRATFKMGRASGCVPRM